MSAPNSSKHFKTAAKFTRVALRWLINSHSENDESQKSEGTDIDDGRLLQKLDIDESCNITINNQGSVLNSHSSVPRNKWLEYFKSKWTSPVDTETSLYYYYSGLIAFIVLYNSVMLIARSTFAELQEKYKIWWLVLDYMGDGLNLIDMFLESKKIILVDGLRVYDSEKLRMNYMRSSDFFVDVVSLLPTDVLFLFSDAKPWIRLNRVFRYRRMFEFSDRTEIRTSMPNTFRLLKLVGLLFFIFHWNACVFFQLSQFYGLGVDQWVFGYEKVRDVYHECSKNKNTNMTSLYFSMLILATIVGSVGSMISSMNASQSQFTEMLDGVKQYMSHRGVDKSLSRTIIKWFGYIWSQKMLLNEDEILDFLPSKLKTELAMQVHLETLKRVRVFQGCDPGLLIELVLKLKLQVFSPGDYICRKGDVGKEMYIVKRGSLNVVSPDGKIVFVTLKEGAVFGELSLLNIAGNKNGNKRSASVRSFGFSDLYVLSKDDLWDALREYPETKLLLLEKGREILRKDNLLDEENAGDQDQTPEEKETLDQRLSRLERKARKTCEQLDQFCDTFANDIARSKKHLSTMENFVHTNKRMIKMKSKMIDGDKFGVSRKYY